MLKNFLYLDAPAVDGYLSSLEDGLRSSLERRESKSSSGGVKAGVPALGGHGELAKEQEDTTTMSDTVEARFERLQRLAHEDVEASGWVDVVNPDVDLDGIGSGALIEVECEIFIPHMIKALSPSGGLGQVLDLMQGLAPFAAAMGSDVSGLPVASQVDAMKGFANALGGDPVFVGEPLDSDWSVAGRLLETYLHGEIEGYAKVVGKVSTQVGTGKWKPLLTLPGMNLLSREQRREMERKGPDAGQEGNWLQGPALMLDVLAIYR